MSAPIVALEAVSKRFGETRAVADFSLAIGEGEFFALLGPSGCGKTTLLRLIAGFETPDAGRILLAGADAARVPPGRRGVNLVFQAYALFPHMSVARNVAFGLQAQRLAAGERARRVAEMLALVGLESLADRRPGELSGGEKQRVALARALATRPRLLLLDEPLSALDARLREQMQSELARLQRQLGIAFLLVTHDQGEALALADRCAVMRAGRLEQVGRPADLYERPANRFVADFIGRANLFEGRLGADGRTLACADFPAPVRLARRFEAACGALVWAALRPEAIALQPLEAAAASGTDHAEGDVRRALRQGPRFAYEIELASGRLVRVASPAGAPRFAPGDRVRLAWLAGDLSILRD